jgi:DNA-directed RNA polymerase specialized sigma24 family protein
VRVEEAEEDTALYLMIKGWDALEISQATKLPLSTVQSLYRTALATA